MLSTRPVWFVLALLLAAGGCGDDPIDPNPDPDPDSAGYAFVYTPPAGAPAITSISVRGSFNDWGEAAMVRQADGSWVAYIELDSTTTYSYKFFINGAWVSDMCNDGTWGHSSAGGMVHLDADGCEPDGFDGQNALITLGEVGLGFTHTAGAPEYVSIAGGMLSVRFRARDGEVASARVVAGPDTIAMHPQFRIGLQQIWRAALPAATTSYRFLLDTDDGAETFGPYSAPADPFRSVSWASDAVAYQIFPERFWNGDPSNDSLTLSTDEFVYNVLWTTNGPTLSLTWDGAPNNQHCCHQYFGGDLQGIVDRIGHLVALGVTVVYLNPIWHGGSAHGYDTFDYLQVAPEFGDAAMLRTFVDALHGAGIRIIWDFVPNHVGLGFWAFQHAVQNGHSSPYWNWFNFHPDGDSLQAGDGDDYDGWWGSGSMPELQTEVPAVMSHLMDVAAHWTEYGFDGIRVDVPGDIDNRQAFFSALRTTTKSIDPDVYLVAEIWGRDPSWLQGDQFDALMNYAIGRDVVQRYTMGQMNGSAAWTSMAQLYAAYAEAASAMLFNVIATHDTDRLLTQLGGGELGGTPTAAALERQRMASALLYAIPGMPVTYYGDECAMLGSASGSIHRGRRTMQWDSCDAGMLEHYIQLGELKRTIDALGSPVIREHQSIGAVLSFLRGEPGVGEVLAVFNQSTSGQTVALPAGTWTDSVSGASLSGSAEIGAYGWRYLVRS